MSKWQRRLSDLRRPSARSWSSCPIIVLIGIIFWLDFVSGPGREPAELYGVPVLLAAVVIGVTGVMVAVTACGILYLAALWIQGTPYYYEDLATILLLYFLGLVTAQLVNEYLRIDEIYLRNPNA